MRLAVLASPESWYLRDLRRAAACRHTIDCLPHSQLAAFAGEFQAGITSGEQGLSAYDAVLVRSMPPGSLEQVIFRMDALAQCEAAGTLVLNPPRAMEVAIDKYLATARLAAAGLTTPATWVCQTVEDGLRGFERLGGDVVLKPLFGGEGRGISRLQDPDLARRAFQLLASLGGVIYLQRFVEHEGCDLRLFVLGERVFGMRRVNRLDWRTNVSRGATTERLVVEDALRELALKAARSIGAPIAGIDFLPGRDGCLYALEVNAVPGWRALARTLHEDVAARVLEYIAGRTCGARK